MITDKNHKILLAAGLKLRDQLGGHHFIQCTIGGAGATNGRANPSYACRDCDVKAEINPEAWRVWCMLLASSPEDVLDVLLRRDCP